MKHVLNCLITIFGGLIYLLGTLLTLLFMSLITVVVVGMIACISTFILWNPILALILLMAGVSAILIHTESK